LYTEVIEYDAGRLLHISRVHAMQVQKALVFTSNYSVWVNTFCHAICCIYVQLNTWASEGGQGVQRPPGF